MGRRRTTKLQVFRRWVAAILLCTFALIGGYMVYRGVAHQPSGTVHNPPASGRLIPSQTNTPAIVPTTTTSFDCIALPGPPSAACAGLIGP